MVCFVPEADYRKHDFAVLDTLGVLVLNALECGSTTVDLTVSLDHIPRFVLHDL